MKSLICYVVAIPILAIAVTGLTGCYTQVGTVRDEPDRFEEFADEQEQYPDTVAQQDYEEARNRFYSDYYYPWYGVGIGFGYYNPWYYPGYYPANYYPYYDPWYGWCGTYYPYYPGCNPWYPYGGYYNYPAYTYRIGNNVTYRDGGPYGATRTFGSTRTAGGTRTSSAVAPSGRSYQPGLGKGSSESPALPRAAASSRSGNRPASAGSSSSGSSRGSSREGVRSGSSRPASSPGSRGGVRRYEPAPSYTPPAPSSSGGSSGSSERSSGGHSYSPPAPAPSSPPSGEGRAPTNTGQRGSERRN